MADYGDSGIPQRIWDNLYPEPNTGCWLWAAGWTHDGYGRVWFDGRDAEGMQRDHLCRVRCCANPEHIEVVTQYVNTMRGAGFAAVNARKLNCPSGHPYTVRRGERICKPCDSAASMRYAARSRSREGVPR